MFRIGWVVAASLLAAASSVGTLPAGPAAASAMGTLPAGPAAAPAKPQVSVPPCVGTFTYTGAPQNCEVAQAATLTVTAYGGSGGNSDYNGTVEESGAQAGETFATFNVPAGTLLTINVGGAGADGQLNTGDGLDWTAGQGGYGSPGGGGTGGIGDGYIENPSIVAGRAGGGGGGATEIDGPSGLLVIAGGGGGAGGDGSTWLGGKGGIGGANPGSGDTGHTSDGGAGGCGGCATTQPGGNGSSAGSGTTGGGGGGAAAGWKGGEGGGGGRLGVLGGGGGGGGGGGSSYASVPNPSFYDGVWSGNGEVLITSTTSTALTSSVNPSTPGQQVTYTATVSPAPTAGVVDFTDGGQSIPGCSGLFPNPQSGAVTCQVTYSAEGSHTIQAQYSGAGSLSGSTSNTVTQVVGPPTGTTVTVVPPPAPDVFIADTVHSRVVEVPAGGGAQTPVGSGLNGPQGVVVDALGDVFIADTENDRVVEVPATGAPQTTIGSGLNGPEGVAVDTAGDVFIADTGNSRVVEVPAGGGSQTTVGSGLMQPGGVAVDAARDLFIADTGNNRVVEVPAGGGAQTPVGSGFLGPGGVAVDPAGDVFVADSIHSRVVEVPADGGPQTTVGSGLKQPEGVAVDAAGDVLIADSYNNRVVEVPADGAPQITIGSGLSVPFGVAVDVPPTTTTFGAPVFLTATVIPTPGLTGTVAFTDTANGATITLGSATLSSAKASLSAVLPAVGTNSIVASYSGSSTYSASTSAPIRVQVAPTTHLLMVAQARFSGPGQAGSGAIDDWYLDLVDNSASPLSLAGWQVNVVNAAGTVEPIALPAVTLPAGGAYLVAGSQYSLDTVATPDLTTATLSVLVVGSQLAPPASANASPTDEVGYSTAPAGYQGSAGGLEQVGAMPTVQYAFIRHGSQAVPVDTDDNASDFSLVSTTGGTVGGQTSILGSPSPLSTTSPQQVNAETPSTLLDPGVAASRSPNRIYTAGSPATLVVNRTITNNTGKTITELVLRITDLTEQGGPPSGAHAWLRVVASSANNGAVSLSPNTPVGANGGGLGTTLSPPTPVSLAPGASISVAFEFAVDRGGSFSFGYDVDAGT